MVRAMGKVWRGFVWAVGRNTEVGKKLLGQQTDLEKAAERIERMRQAEQLRDRLDELQGKLDQQIASARAAGQMHQYQPYVGSGMLGNVPVIIKFHGNNDPTKMDIYYGGEGVPDGPGHSHITMRRGVIDTWWLPSMRAGIGNASCRKCQVGLRARLLHTRPKPRTIELFFCF